jgi:hypothetical protein
VTGTSGAVLIDHGHAFGARRTTSEFAMKLEDEPVSPRHRLLLEELIARRGSSRLATLLDEEEVSGVYERATAIAEAGYLRVGSAQYVLFKTD